MRATESAETACIIDHHGKPGICPGGIVIISWQMRMGVAQNMMMVRNVQILRVKDKMRISTRNGGRIRWDIVTETVNI